MFPRGRMSLGDLEHKECLDSAHFKKVELMLISSSLEMLFSLSFASEFQCEPELILYFGYLYQCISSCLKFSSASYFLTCKEQSVKHY